MEIRFESAGGAEPMQEEERKQVCRSVEGGTSVRDEAATAKTVDPAASKCGSVGAGGGKVRCAGGCF